MAGLFCLAQQNRLTVLERSKAMGIGDAARSALVRSNSGSSLDFYGLLQCTNIDVDQQQTNFSTDQGGGKRREVTAFPVLSFTMKHAPFSSTDEGRSALTVQDGRQVRASDADPMNVEGVFGKSVGSNFGVRATSPGAVGILSEIPALDLRGERRFRFSHSCLLICLLSVRRADVVGAH